MNAINVKNQKENIKAIFQFDRLELWPDIIKARDQYEGNSDSSKIRDYY